MRSFRKNCPDRIDQENIASKGKKKSEEKEKEEKLTHSRKKTPAIQNSVSSFKGRETLGRVTERIRRTLEVYSLTRFLTEVSYKMDWGGGRGELAQPPK